jgi:hypothetical protein
MHIAEPLPNVVVELVTSTGIQPIQRINGFQEQRKQSTNKIKSQTEAEKKDVFIC